MLLWTTGKLGSSGGQIIVYRSEEKPRASRTPSERTYASDGQGTPFVPDEKLDQTRTLPENKDGVKRLKRRATFVRRLKARLFGGSTRWRLLTATDWPVNRRRRNFCIAVCSAPAELTAIARPPAPDRIVKRRAPRLAWTQDLCYLAIPELPHCLMNFHTAYG